MAEDLKRQATELYRERSVKEALPTSDSLSTRKMTYISLGIVLAIVIVIQSLGGLTSKRVPAKAATPTAPLPLPPPPNPTDESPSPQPESPPPSPAAQPVAAPEKPKPSEEPAASPDITPKRAISEPAPRESRPALRREAPTSARTPTDPGAKTERAPATPREPEVSAVELARQELARDIVMGKNPALAKLIANPGANLEYQGWKAAAEGAEVYNLTFTFLDKISGRPLLYVWRVDMNARSIAPLSYYARKLS